MVLSSIFGLGRLQPLRPNTWPVKMLRSWAFWGREAWPSRTCRPMPQFEHSASPKSTARIESTAKAWPHKCSRELPFEIIAVDSPQLAVKNSDIVASCTDAGEAVLLGDWLEDGMHITTVNHREADPQVYRRISRYIDYRSGPAINLFTTGEEHRPRTIGGAGADHDNLVASSAATVRLRFADVLLGRVLGRQLEGEINLFKSEGMGVQFAALGQLAYLRCKEERLGCELPLEWFIQRIRN